MRRKSELNGEVIELLFDLFTAASKRRGELQSKWINVLSRLAGEYESIGVLRLQSDHRIDLVLRAIEDEIASRGSLSSAAGDAELISLDFLTALTRYWVFSSYETLKVAKNSEKGKLDSKLQATYQRFRLVWLSFAKPESSYGALKSQREVGYYRPVGTFNRRTGSLGWRVLNPDKGQEETIFRRDLSDRLITLFD
jgi:hypothetical protein